MVKGNNSTKLFSGDGHDGDHGVELLEYEWPDLPPLPTIKDAMTRSRVSHGISYLLPIDKGRNSINNKFRTDLRAMFQVNLILISYQALAI